MFKAVESTTRLGFPLVLAVISIRWHHVTGSLTGTFSKTPSSQSLSRPLFTSDLQCNGTWGGVCTATGTASSLTNRRNGGDLSMRGNGCFSQQLNADPAYRSRMYCFSVGRFSSVGGHGRIIGEVGGSVLRGHWQGWSSGPGTPVLEQGWRRGVVTERISDLSGLSQEPTVGKFAGTKPRSIHALSDRYGTLT